VSAFYFRAVARPLRLNVPGACFHLIARGNNKQFVFLGEKDFVVFLELFARVIERFAWVVYAYCLMGNHYHLVVETPYGNLSRGMAQLNGGFARHFNHRHGHCGHVFQARFTSILVETDTSLKNVCRYAVLNPLRAGICDEPQEWLWSSYRATAGIDQSPAWLASDRLLAGFGRDRPRAQAAYRQFVFDGIGKTLDQEIVGERIGKEQFLRNRFGQEFQPEIPNVQIEPLPPTLLELFSAADPTPVATAYRRHGYTLRDIAEHLGCHYATVSRRLRREEALLTGPDAKRISNA
jgi:REP-associated tyrosine transposase